MFMTSLIVLLIIYIILNIAAFLLFGFDKLKSKLDSWRTPEKTLIGISALGPFGAFAGMTFFRHKTKKQPFPIVVPLFVLIHIVLFVSLSFLGLISLV